MKQIYFLDLKSEALGPEYDDWHRTGRVPEEVLADIKSSGVESMEIYRVGKRLVLISETSGDAPATDRVASKASENWEALMERFQEPIDDVPRSEKWVEARKIFDLSEHTN